MSTQNAVFWAKRCKRFEAAAVKLANALAATGEAPTIERHFAALADKNDGALTAWDALKKAMDELEESERAA